MREFKGGNIDIPSSARYRERAREREREGNKPDFKKLVGPDGIDCHKLVPLEYPAGQNLTGVLE
jgi:hypothetical protein